MAVQIYRCCQRAAPFDYRSKPAEPSLRAQRGYLGGLAELPTGTGSPRRHPPRDDKPGARELLASMDRMGRIFDFPLISAHFLSFE